MEMLRTQGVDMKKVAGEVIAFAKRSTLSKAISASPCWSDRTSLSISDSCNS